MAIYLDDLFDGGGFEEGGGDALFDPEDYAGAGGYPDCGTSEFDGFEGVFDLEEAAFGGEGVDAAVWRLLAMVRWNGGGRWEGVCTVF